MGVLRSFNATLDGDSLIRPGEKIRGAETVAEQLAVKILSGEFAEGHVFPSEVTFANEIGISRSALREAFRVLSAKGLVDSRPKAGTKVRARRRWSLLDPDLLAWQFKAEPSAKFIRDLFELRMMVEPNAAQMAALRRSDADVAVMSEALDLMAHYGLADARGRRADQRFHMTMLEATRNEMVTALATSIMAAIAWTTICKQRKRALPRDPMPEHRALFRAIAAGDPSAAHGAMVDLITLALRDTEVSLQDNGGGFPCAD
ncbi:DNA-binding FadR family transcriptional regulator [Sphingomonas jinjuensis]|uniref:DNA-binding FadR family transcriptional regulator n=1 Tax=Sphingomonas jinjuensis TaxID=535907 RepID=A0A840F301_9SPHN|nr:FadR/GntR family transcriptional regulator [Sphingomonas jinjuensis]MBB4153723.1 DNA-binding FadR family transcriptional regulator [Sphingomonas jinjuensis]